LYTVKVNGSSYPRYIIHKFPGLVKLFPEGVYIKELNCKNVHTLHELKVLFTIIELFASGAKKAYQPKLSQDITKSALIEEAEYLHIRKFAPCPYAKGPCEILQRLLPTCTIELKNGGYISIWYQCYSPQFYSVERALGGTQKTSSLRGSNKLRIPDLMISQVKVILEKAREEPVKLNGVEGVKALNIYTVRGDKREPFAIIARSVDDKYYWIHRMNREWTPDIIVECKESKGAYEGERMRGWQDYLTMKAKIAKILVSIVHPSVNIGDFILVYDRLSKEKLQDELKRILANILATTLHRGLSGSHGI